MALTATRPSFPAGAAIGLLATLALHVALIDIVTRDPGRRTASGAWPIALAAISSAVPIPPSDKSGLARIVINAPPSNYVGLASHAETRLDVWVATLEWECQLPKYPVAALQSGEQGAVTVELRIGADGFVRDTSLVRSSGHALLDEAALSALRDCRFIPRTENGKSVEGRTDLEFVWRHA